MRHIKPGTGFWNITRYPYGGDFGRAFKDRPLNCDLIPGSFEQGKGWTVKLLENCGHNKMGDFVKVHDDSLSVELT